MPKAISSTRLILASILAILVYGMIAAMLGTILPFLSKQFALGPVENGNIAMAQAAGLIIASLSAGPLVDSKGKKVGILSGLGLIALALFLLPSSTGYGMILGVLFLLGLGGGLLVTAANALVADIDPSRRSSTLNLLNLFFGLGGMLTPFIYANMLNQSALLLCYLTAVLTVVTLLVNGITPMPAPTGERGFQVSEVGGLMRTSVLWLLALYLLLYVACEVGVFNWLTRHLIAQGIPESTATNILSLGFALGLLVGRVVVSRILIKVAPENVTLVAAALIAATTYWMLNTSDPTMAGIAVFCAGLAMAPVFPTVLGMTGDAFPRATATAMGIVITFGWLGLAMSSGIIGALGGDDARNLKSALLVIPAAGVVMVLVNLALRPMMKAAKQAGQIPAA